MHRAEAIMQAVETVVTGLTTTGARVERTRVRTVETAPSLTVEMGNDGVNLDRSSYPKIYRDLDIKIIAHVKNNVNPDEQLNIIRSEVYIALMADTTLGLSYVSDTIPTSDDEPEFTGDADQIVGRQQLNFTIMYSHSWNSPEV